jgi:hypothetical protein
VCWPTAGMSPIVASRPGTVTGGSSARTGPPGDSAVVAAGGVAAARALDLDDPGAEVGDLPGGERRGHRLLETDDGDPRQSADDARPSVVAGIQDRAAVGAHEFSNCLRRVIGQCHVRDYRPAGPGDFAP